MKSDPASSKKRVLVIYHFFHPDNVVSSRLFSDFAAGLVKRGWEVSALTSNRFRRAPKSRIFEGEEVWRGIRIHRTPRPAFDQSSNFGRLLNTAWLITRWITFIARRPAYDAIVLGTDPQFGYFMLPFIRLMKRRTKLCFWAFDLYPEAIIANGMGGFLGLVSLVKPITRICYRRIDGMADIGPCMRNRLDTYGHRADRTTLVPWALTEPDVPLQCDPDTRRELFGDAKLTLLYSGTIGNAHQFRCFIALARELRRRGASVSFCFSGHGNRYDELRSMVSARDTNISFSGFADESQLAKRLSAGDIHMLSLRDGWEGVVVPSKFFGSLAAGRPVLYEGTPKSAIKTWIDRYQLGYIVDEAGIQQTADQLCRLANDPSLLRQKQHEALKCYRDNFSKEKVLDDWHQFLNRIIDDGAAR